MELSKTFHCILFALLLGQFCSISTNAEAEPEADPGRLRYGWFQKGQWKAPLFKKSLELRHQLTAKRDRPLLSLPKVRYNPLVTHKLSLPMMPNLAPKLQRGPKGSKVKKHHKGPKVQKKRKNHRVPALTPEETADEKLLHLTKYRITLKPRPIKPLIAKIPKVPKLRIPKRPLPTLKPLRPIKVKVPKLPNLKAPKVPKLPKVKVPKVTKLPKIQVPKVPKLPEITKIKLPTVTKKPQLAKLPKIKAPEHFPTDHFETPDIPDIKFPSGGFGGGFGPGTGFGPFNTGHSSEANYKQQYPRLPAPAPAPDYGHQTPFKNHHVHTSFKHHQLPDELDSNGGHPSYHPHNGQFTFGKTKELNSFFKDKQKNHHLGNYKNKFGLYDTPDGYKGDIKHTIGNNFHEGRKEEKFAFQVFPKLPNFNTYDHDIIDHNLIKIKQNKVADQFKFNYHQNHNQQKHNLVKDHMNDVADQFKFSGPLNLEHHNKNQFKISAFDNHHTPKYPSFSPPSQNYPSLSVPSTVFPKPSPGHAFSDPIYRDHTMEDGFGDTLKSDEGADNVELPESDFNTLTMMNDVQKLKTPDDNKVELAQKAVEQRRLFIGDRRSHQHRGRRPIRPRPRVPVYQRSHKRNPPRKAWFRQRLV